MSLAVDKCCWMSLDGKQRTPTKTRDKGHGHGQGQDSAGPVPHVEWGNEQLVLVWNEQLATMNGSELLMSW